MLLFLLHDWRHGPPFALLCFLSLHSLDRFNVKSKCSVLAVGCRSLCIGLYLCGHLFCYPGQTCHCHPHCFAAPLPRLTQIFFQRHIPHQPPSHTKSKARGLNLPRSMFGFCCRDFAGWILGDTSFGFQSIFGGPDILPFRMLLNFTNMSS